ncbi:hypothetical protein Tsubulata_001946 [Turnera subulata]|uniref:Oberon PHD finger domain-containing protein n=1 Tax=Turnera subulata TaxID=218843 RepID=A0A9Q0FJZ7_9ROSI|nr:hypothetical protein Tsubulata_001946 [Turnera subulata]
MSKQGEERSSGLAAEEFSGFLLDPKQRSLLGLSAKRELVRNIVLWRKDAPEILTSFTRRELREIICAEMGKERKYSGYTKFQMIEHLFKLVSKKPDGSNDSNIIPLSPAKTVTALKWQMDEDPGLQESTDGNHISPKSNIEDHTEIRVCQNVACRAPLGHGDSFCKRCSCCICHYYDDNKDPSLWLTCGSDTLSERSCGLTCHLICALKDERTGIMKIASVRKLEGCFFCVSCRQINGLMRTWRKQLVVAKEARRVDVLCLRVLLGCRILTTSERYKEIREKLETALAMLENELGPLDLVCEKMARGIVNRLSCGAEVQKLCAASVNAFDSVFCEQYPVPAYVEKKAASFQIGAQGSSHELQLVKDNRKNKNEELCSLAPSTEAVSVPGLGFTRYKEEGAYEFSVRVVKWLEHEGHIDEDFRVKFLTWFSLKATTKERRVVSTFIDAMIDDPPSLAGQLIHTFMDEIYCNKESVPCHGFGTG